MINLKLKKEPRVFNINGYDIYDFGEIELSPDANSNHFVTITTQRKKKIDITATDFGFYLGGSFNDRLKKEGIELAIIENSKGQKYLVAIEQGREEAFKEYLKKNNSKLILSIS